MSKSSHYRDEAIIKAFGERVRKYRVQNGYTIEGFANSITKVEVHPTQLARIERGETNVTISFIKLLADEFGVSLSDLLTDL